MRFRLSILVVFALALLGGGTTYLGHSEDRVLFSWGIQDASFTVDHSSCYPVGTVWSAATDARAVCYVPPDRTLVLEAITVHATDALDSGNEDCEIILETTSTGSDAAGTDIASSSIDVGDSNANSGKCGDVTIDGRGEYCFRTLDSTDANTVVGGGGWWTVTLHAGSSGCGGTCTCTDMQGIAVNVIAHYQ